MNASTENIEDLQQIELSIEQAKDMIAKMEAVERLKQNYDFKKLFLDGYLKEYAVSLVHRKTMPGLQDEKNQKYIEHQLISISALVQYLNYVAQEGMTAKQALEAHYAERDQLLEEQEA